MVGKQVHEEILALIDRAERVVVLISPFVRPWPELTRALARAVVRGVRIILYTRPAGSRGAPSGEELEVFGLLEAKVYEVRRMHHKAYLSEREALVTSANLTAEAVGKAVELAMRFERAADTSRWNQVFEIWQKTADEWRRDGEQEPTSFSDVLTDLRTRAIRGDASARDQHCFCIICGETASQEADEVVCLRCRARAMADDRDPHDVHGERCARCGGAWPFAVPSRPLCGDCFQWERARDEARHLRWYVSGETGRIAAWWSDEREKGLMDGAPDAVEKSVRERWGVLMEGCTSVRGTLVASRPRGVPLWAAPTVPEHGFGAEVRTVVLERPPVLAIPSCPEARGLDVAEGFYATWTADAENPRFDRWEAQERLADWKLILHGEPKEPASWRTEWFFQIVLAARRSLNRDVLLDPERVGLILHVGLGVPEAALPRWTSIVGHATHAMLAAMHTYEDAEVTELFSGAAPSVLETIRALLTTPGPMGPVTLGRSSKGRIESVPARNDRVVAIRARVRPAENYVLVGTVETGRPSALQLSDTAPA